VPKAALTLSLLVLAVALAGCGGTRAVRPTPSPAAFARDADRICARATTRGGRVARLRALRPPAGASNLFLHWMRAEKDALDVSEAIAAPGATFDKDPRIALSIAQGKIVGYARRLGAGTCAATAGGTMRR
jgi:hypothetical protein